MGEVAEISTGSTSFKILSPNLMNLSRVSIRQKPVSIERRLKSWNIEYNFKGNQPYLSLV